MELANWQQINNESPDFRGENWHPYTVSNDQDEDYKTYETDPEKAKKVEFSAVINRYLLYLKKIYLGTESEEGIEIGEPDSEGLDGLKKVPNPQRIFNFVHNLERFRTHPGAITIEDVEKFTSLLDYLGRIFFRLPRLFYRFP